MASRAFGCGSLATSKNDDSGVSSFKKDGLTSGASLTHIFTNGKSPPRPIVEREMIIAGGGVRCIPHDASGRIRSRGIDL